MKLGGVVGTLRIKEQDLSPFWPFLWLGQWTHAGSAASMGNGAYELASLPSPHIARRRKRAPEPLVRRPGLVSPAVPATMNCLRSHSPPATSTSCAGQAGKRSKTSATTPITWPPPISLPSTCEHSPRTKKRAFMCRSQAAARRWFFFLATRCHCSAARRTDCRMFWSHRHSNPGTGERMRPAFGTCPARRTR